MCLLYVVTVLCLDVYVYVLIDICCLAEHCRSMTVGSFIGWLKCTA